jgi:hypothetical protein
MRLTFGLSLLQLGIRARIHHLYNLWIPALKTAVAHIRLGPITLMIQIPMIKDFILGLAIFPFIHFAWRSYWFSRCFVHGASTET